MKSVPACAVRAAYAALTAKPTTEMRTMGQYHKIVNLDKKQYLHPHKFGDGMKLMEFGSSGDGTMLALAVLLAEDNGKGGGDLRSDHPVVGSWARDRIAVVGDYGDDDPGSGMSVYAHVGEDGSGWADVSDEALTALSADGPTARAFVDRLRYRRGELPDAIRRRITEVQEKDLNAPGFQDEQPHVRLAHAVLRAPDDPALWRVFLDACLEKDGR